MLDHNKDPCSNGFIPKTQVKRLLHFSKMFGSVLGDAFENSVLKALCAYICCVQGKVYVMYIAMESRFNYDHWMKLATVLYI